MSLRITVISYKSQPPFERLEAFFDHQGGTVGRLRQDRKNHLTLPDPEHYVSRSHVSITFENGRYYLTDTSVNGTFIQNRNMRVHQGRQALADADRLTIGEYELVVHIDRHTADSFAGGCEHDGNGGFGLPVNTIEAGNDLFGEPDDPFSNQDGLKPGHVIEQAEPLPIHDSFSPPPVAGNPNQTVEIPKDFDFRRLVDNPDRFDGIPKPAETPRDAGSGAGMALPGRSLDGGHRAEQGPPRTPAPAKLRPAAPNVPGANGRMRRLAQLEMLQVFCDAAGIEENTSGLQSADIPAVMQTVGAVFREMVEGLMAVLRGRAEFKNQLRVQATSLNRDGNNPLKFSRAVDEVLKHVLTEGQPGFLNAVEAVREGFADVMNHQMAMTAGMQASVLKLLERFDPREISKTLEEGVVFQKKAKAWDCYRQSYDEIARGALEDFLGEAFARAYEQQLRKLGSGTDERARDRGVADADEQ